MFQSVECGLLGEDVRPSGGPRVWGGSVRFPRGALVPPGQTLSPSPVPFSQV